MIDHPQVFEDAFEDAISEPFPANNNIKSNSSSASKSHKKFKLSKKLHRKTKKRAPGEEIPLGEALEESKMAVDLFLNNKFDEAKEIVEPL